MMCRSVTEHLESGFGLEELPVEMRRHINECPACSSLYEELSSLRERIESSPDFDLSPADLDRAISAVETGIDESYPTGVAQVSSRRESRPYELWLQRVSRVAAAILLVAATYGAYLIGQNRAGSGDFDESATISSSAESLTTAWPEEETAELDDGMIRTLIEDLSAKGYFEAGEALLEDLSDEEMEYLIENLDVGDLM